MTLATFIRKTIQNIEESTTKTGNKKSSNATTIISDISFDLTVIVKDKDIIVVEKDEKKKSDQAPHHRIKFSIKFGQKNFSLSELLDQIEKAG